LVNIADCGLIGPDGFPKIPVPEGYLPRMSKFNDADLDTSKYAKQLENAKEEHTSSSQTF
jgi:hypothetical protein